uniref:GIR1-like zinc ribbon domain-containing protein n=1 Tax=Noccaea caerulescens TaxID=107243 RepID=A0A1J3GAM5_NOCCA
MAADVSSLVRLLSVYNDDRAVVKESAGAKSTAALMTRDLLGSGRGGGDRSLELDLDLQVPNGWEKRLDLKSGKVYLQRCNSTSSSSITTTDQSNQTVPTFQDLNFPPIPSNSQAPAKPLLNLFDDTTPELKLLPPSRSRPLSLPSSNSNFQSVCTLDKVKSALERAERDPAMFKKRQSPDDTVSDHYRTTEIASPVAAGCPGCLSYVLVMKNNPKCPRCDTIVPLPTNTMKKPKIDLNISI